MTYRPMFGRIGYWLREYGDTTERTTDRILDTLTAAGGDCLCLKVADGLTWQGLVDPSGLTPVRSLDDLLLLRDACHARGVSLLPVVVPRGEDPAAEAALHGQIAATAGALMTDIEPFRGFWDRSPLSDIPRYTAALRAAAPDAYLINQPDPRGANVTSARVEETKNDFDAIAAQHYVGWSVGSFESVDTEVERFQRLQAFGREMYVTLWGTERPHLALAFWERVKADCLGVNIFALGFMNATHLGAFTAITRPVQPPDPLDGSLIRVSIPSDHHFTRNPATGWLLPAAGPVTAGFGATEEPRDSGATYLGQRYAHFNKGIDIGSPTGTPVRATTAGSVTIAGNIGDGWDTAIKITDDDGVTHNYGHLAGIDVTVGQRVARGQVIGTSGAGDPAHSTGPHLSYDVFRASAVGKEWIDATLYLEPSDLVVAGIEARVVNAGGANLRVAPSMEAHRLLTLADGARLRLRRAAIYPLAWPAAGSGEMLWSGHYTVDPAARPATANPGDPLAKPAATITVIRDPFFGSRALTHEAGVWSVRGPAPGGAALALALPEWYPVQAEGRRGWVHASLLAFTAIAIPPEERRQGLARGLRFTVTDDEVRFRSAPALGENVLGHAGRGTVVALRTAAYVPIDFHGSAGWVWAEFLTLHAPAGAPTPGLGMVVAAGRTPNVRAAPDERAALLGQVSAGTRLTPQSKAFYPVRWNDRDGWLWGEFLTATAD